MYSGVSSQLVSPAINPRVQHKDVVMRMRHDGVLMEECEPLLWSLLSQ